MDSMFCLVLSLCFIVLISLVVFSEPSYRTLFFSSPAPPFPNGAFPLSTRMLTRECSLLDNQNTGRSIRFVQMQFLRMSHNWQERWDEGSALTCCPSLLYVAVMKH